MQESQERSDTANSIPTTRVEEVLEEMAVEEPPLPAEVAAARAGVTCRHLPKLFPDLWCELVARHATYKKDENARSRNAFQAEVRRIAQELLSTSKYPRSVIAAWA